MSASSCSDQLIVVTMLHSDLSLTDEYIVSCFTGGFCGKFL